MSLEFLKSSRGQKILDLFESVLYKKHISKHYCITVCLKKENIEDILNQEFLKGSKYIDCISVSDFTKILIFEKYS